MSESNGVVLSPGQLGQFRIEMDRFAEAIRAQATNPVIELVIGQALERAKSRPEETMGLLLTIGQQVSEALTRIRDAGIAPQVSERGSE